MSYLEPLAASGYVSSVHKRNKGRYAVHHIRKGLCVVQKARFSQKLETLDLICNHF